MEAADFCFMIHPLPKMRPSPGLAASVAVLALFIAAALHAEEPAALHPYAGPSERGVDTTTLTGKMMCGYQGWFNAEGDGANLGFRHWTHHGDRKSTRLNSSH